MAFQPLTNTQFQKALNSGFSTQEIVNMEKRRKAQEEGGEKGYFSRVFAEYAEAGQDIISGIQTGAERAAGVEDGLVGGFKAAGHLLRTGLRTVGGVAKATFAPITEAPGIRQALEFTGEQVAKIPGVETLVSSLDELAKKHPEAAKDIQNVIDVSVLALGTKAQRPAGTKLTTAGVRVEASGIRASMAAKQNFASKLVSPIETKAVKLATVGRTTEAGGFFKRDIVTPTRLEVLSAKEVARIPGISSRNTFQKNFNIVRDFNVVQANKLADDVAKYNFPIPKNVVIAQLDDAASSLKKSPLIVGDAEKTANKLLLKAKELVNSNSANGSGILKARKQFDNWVKTQKPKVFDAKAENAFTIANERIRQTLNAVLDENAINLGVKDSLTRQSSLFRAMTNIGPKAAIEANSPLYRVLERVGRVLGIKSRAVQGIAAAVGIGGLGAAATFAPAVAVLGGIGFITYKAGKLVMSPQVRIALGRLLKESGHLMNPVDKKIIEDAIRRFSD